MKLFFNALIVFCVYSQAAYAQNSINYYSKSTDPYDFVAMLSNNGYTIENVAKNAPSLSGAQYLLLIDIKDFEYGIHLNVYDDSKQIDEATKGFSYSLIRLMGHRCKTYGYFVLCGQRGEVEGVWKIFD